MTGRICKQQMNINGADVVLRLTVCCVRSPTDTGVGADACGFLLCRCLINFIKLNISKQLKQTVTKYVILCSNRRLHFELKLIGFSRCSAKGTMTDRNSAT